MPTARKATRIPIIGSKPKLRISGKNRILGELKTEAELRKALITGLAADINNVSKREEYFKIAYKSIDKGMRAVKRDKITLKEYGMNLGQEIMLWSQLRDLINKEVRFKDIKTKMDEITEQIDGETFWINRILAKAA